MALLAAVLLIIVVIGLIFILKNKKTAPDRTEQAAAATPTSSQTDKPEKEYDNILNSLLDLNILIRKDNALPEEFILEIESIVDDLMVVIPAMMDRYPGETLTYEIKKIGNTHLYRTVKEYLDLSVDSRTKQLDTFRQTIESLKQVSNRSRDIVEKNETAEFKTMASFLSSKFS